MRRLQLRFACPVSPNVAVRRLRNGRFTQSAAIRVFVVDSNAPWRYAVQVNDVEPLESDPRRFYLLRSQYQRRV